MTKLKDIELAKSMNTPEENPFDASLRHAFEEAVARGEEKKVGNDIDAVTTTEEKANYMQVGRTLECGHCFPGKYQMLPTSVKCQCQCHDDNSLATPQTMEKDWNKVAELFHDTYETLAPSYGYETREDTKQFDPESKNGKLMVAVCKFVLTSEIQRAKEDLLQDVGYICDRRYPGIKNCPMDSLKQCERCQERGQMWEEIKKYAQSKGIELK